MIPPQHNADFTAGMERGLDICRRPCDAHLPVVCIDETARQLIGETRRSVPMAPGRPVREDCEYRRACNVFMATEPRVGRRQAKASERGTRTDRACFPRGPAAQEAGATRITLVVANLNTHRPDTLYEAFELAEAKALRDRLEFVHTPKDSSWPNVAEVERNVMIRQCLNRRIDSIDTLGAGVAAGQAARDRIKARIDWQYTTDNARVRLEPLSNT